MHLERVTALFVLAGIEVESFYELANQYWPDCDTYSDIRRKNPWWLVKTNHGLIKIGWRKRVISIDWSDTKYRDGISTFADGRPLSTISTDSVTKTETMIHAWGYGSAVEYLTTLDLRLRQVSWSEENVG